MKALVTAWFVLGLTIGSAAFGSWYLENCSTTGDAARSRAEYRSSLQKATPGTALYTPNAFPSSDSQVVENFLYYHKNAFSATSWAELPAPDRRFFELLEQDQLRFEVLKVVNWNGLRCGPRKERAFFHVIRAFDRASGEELLRASVEDNGHVARVRHKPQEGVLPAISPISGVVSSVAGRFGLRPANPQYVSTWGTLRCDEVQPCVAFQAGGTSYLAINREGAPVYRIEGASRRLSLSRDLTPAQRDAHLKSLRKLGQDLVSLGFDAFVPATRVVEPRP